MSANNSNCTSPFGTPLYQGVVYVEAVASAIAWLCVLLMVILIFLFKKHHFLTQRLILYLAFAHLASYTVGMLNILGYWADEDIYFHYYCIVMGFLQQIVSWWEILAVFCIMVDIFTKVMFNRMTERFEWLYIIAIFLSPILLTSWIPFVFNEVMYGPLGPVCWIPVKSIIDCSDIVLGFLLQLVLYYVPMYLMMVILFVLLAVSLVTLHRQSKQWAGIFEPAAIERKRLMKLEVQPLVAYPIIVILCHVLLSVSYVYGAFAPISNTDAILWYIDACIYHLQGILITFFFVMDPLTRRKLNFSNLSAACHARCTGYDVISDYPISEENIGDSLEVKKEGTCDQAI